MPATTATRVRQDNRRAVLLDAAAGCFRARGFHASSIREIAAAADMLPGSTYYHFESKEALFVAVYQEGVRRISEAVDAAVGAVGSPRARFAAACRAHLETLLDESDYAQVVIRVLPEDVPAVAGDLARHRDGYEARFRDLVDALEVRPGIDRGHLRRFVLGALNWSRHWYRPGHGDGHGDGNGVGHGRVPDTPAQIADALLDCLALPSEADEPEHSRPGVERT